MPYKPPSKRSFPRSQVLRMRIAVFINLAVAELFSVT